MFFVKLKYLNRDKFQAFIFRFDEINYFESFQQIQVSLKSLKQKHSRVIHAFFNLFFSCLFYVFSTF